MDIAEKLAFGDGEGGLVDGEGGFDGEDGERAVVFGVLALDVEVDACCEGDDGFAAGFLVRGFGVVGWTVVVWPAGEGESGCSCGC